MGWLLNLDSLIAGPTTLRSLRAFVAQPAHSPTLTRPDCLPTFNANNLRFVVFPVTPYTAPPPFQLVVYVLFVNVVVRCLVVAQDVARLLHLLLTLPIGLPGFVFVVCALVEFRFDCCSV